MGCTATDPGRGTVLALRSLPLLTSRRHIDLLRVCGAAGSRSRAARSAAAGGV
ncbi:hypothetical protein [Streptomyces zingiberis]|uniref:Uncharacterized protein n=1 Tax=Streptomyces zingiberis TaxID=2053010 RepID=A0ABX1C0V3_9ACTN|nr:hypothetical protein [Streptomyces zingiberis]NJQ01224.1 hypothetical protein [Streptomyces zingiberis]